MKAITIRQPYASLIMARIKTLETRSRPTKIRGRVLIHSALKFHDETPVFDDDGYGAWPYIIALLNELGATFHDEYVDTYAALPRGAILGSVEITDCIPAGDWCKLHNGKGNLDRYAIYEREFALGDLSSNNYVYVLKDPQPLKEPYYWKGSQVIGWEFPLDKLPQNEPISIHL